MAGVSLHYRRLVRDKLRNSYEISYEEAEEVLSREDTLAKMGRGYLDKVHPDEVAVSIAADHMLREREGVKDGQEEAARGIQAAAEEAERRNRAEGNQPEQGDDL